MAKLDLNPGETILKKGTISKLENKFKLRTGTGYLTNQRFMFYRNRLPWLFDMSLLSLFFHNVMDFEIPLTSIATISRGKYGLQQNVLIITNKLGEDQSVILDNFEKWFSPLKDVLREFHRVELVQETAQKWIIRRL